MEKKILYALYILGVIGLTFPFYENSVIGCGFETSTITYESRYLYQDFYDNIKLFKLELLSIIDSIWLSIIFISILFTPIIYFYKKHLVIISLNILTIGYFAIVFINAPEMLVYGAYTLLFQQLTMLVFVIKYYLNRNKKQQIIS